MKKQFIALTGCLAGCLLLQGCVNMAATGVQAVYNHHSLQKKFGDQFTTIQAYQAINKQSKLFKDTNIQITVFNSDVLLAGQVLTVDQKNEAERLIRKLPDIKRVYNLVDIDEPTSSFRHVSDSWITAKVKSRMIASNELDATQVKVMTENGTVYLMGILKPDEAAEAVQIARTTTGVDRVVKIFSYIHISNT